MRAEFIEGPHDGLCIEIPNGPTDYEYKFKTFAQTNPIENPGEGTVTTVHYWRGEDAPRSGIPRFFFAWYRRR